VNRKNNQEKKGGYDVKAMSRWNHAGEKGSNAKIAVEKKKTQGEHQEEPKRGKLEKRGGQVEKKRGGSLIPP